MCAVLRRIRGHIRQPAKFEKASTLLRKLLLDGTVTAHLRDQTFQARTPLPCGAAAAAAPESGLRSRSLLPHGVCYAPCVHA